MFRPAAVGIALALCFAAVPAIAEPFESFSGICLAANGDREDAGARAKGAGWLAMPVEGLDLTGSGLSDPALYVSVDPATLGEKGLPDDFEMLVTGWGAGEDVFKTPGVRLDACAVMSAAGVVETLKRRMEVLVGAPPVDMDGEDVWLLSRVGDRFVAEPDLMSLEEPDLRRLARERKLYIVGILAEDDMAGLILGALRQDE